MPESGNICRIFETWQGWRFTLPSDRSRRGHVLWNEAPLDLNNKFRSVIVLLLQITGYLLHSYFRGFPQNCNGSLEKMFRRQIVASVSQYLTVPCTGLDIFRNSTSSHCGKNNVIETKLDFNTKNRKLDCNYFFKIKNQFLTLVLCFLAQVCVCVGMWREIKYVPDCKRGDKTSASLCAVCSKR